MQVGNQCAQDVGQLRNTRSVGVIRAVGGDIGRGVGRWPGHGCYAEEAELVGVDLDFSGGSGSGQMLRVSVEWS